ncbi:MAG: DUF308 domain-containing protein [Bacteroidaceae bacterium]|nr:DUF308 domain-containing protein [Bacteroidaceae bacterium]
MKFIFILRAVCALAVGFLLVSNPTEMTGLLVQIIGGLFVLSGLMAFVGYFTTSYRTQRARQRLSALADVSAADIRIPSPSTINLVVGTGSMALGIFLILKPALFIHILMFVLGGLLVLLGFYQLVVLIGARRVAPLSFSLFVAPMLVAAAGILVVCYPMQTASLPFIILGVAYILYGVTEFFYGLRLHRSRQQWEARQNTIPHVTEVEAIDVTDVQPDELSD